MNMLNRKKDQKGLSVLEIIMAIGALLLLMPFIYGMIDAQTQKVKQMLIAGKLKELEDVLINYTIVNKDTLESVDAGAKDESDLYLASYGLSLNTENMLIKYFPLRRYFIDSIKYLNENIEGCEDTGGGILSDECPKKLSVTGFLDINKELFENSDGDFSYEALRKIASMAGANFGYYDGEGFVYSISGYWRKPTSDFPGITFDPTNPKIILLIDNSVIKEYNTSLNRLESAKNDMETYIDLSFNNINHIGALNTGQVINSSGGDLLDGDTGNNICTCERWTDASVNSVCTGKELGLGIASPDMSCTTQVLYDSNNTADSGKMIVEGETLVDNIQIFNNVLMQGQGVSSLTVQDYLLLRGELDLEYVGNNNSTTHTTNIYSVKSSHDISLSDGSILNVEDLILSGNSIVSGELEDKKGIFSMEDLSILESLSINEAYFNNMDTASGITYDLNATELRIDEGIDVDALTSNIIRVENLGVNNSDIIIDQASGILTARDIEVDDDSNTPESIKEQFNNLLGDFVATSQKTTQHICSICAKSGGRRSVIELSCQDIDPSTAGPSENVYCGSMLRDYCGDPSSFGSSGLCSSFESGFEN